MKQNLTLYVGRDVDPLRNGGVHIVHTHEHVCKLVCKELNALNIEACTSYDASGMWYDVQTDQLLHEPSSVFELLDLSYEQACAAMDMLPALCEKLHQGEIVVKNGACIERIHPPAVATQGETKTA